MKKVSVIIPTFNRASFLKNSLNSVLDQDYDNIEVIVVDDRSTDDTHDVVVSFQRDNSNILYIVNERIKGPSGARNTGLLKASGDYIAFLDSDDAWLDGHLAKGISILENNPRLDVLFANFTVTDYGSGKTLFDFFDKKDILRGLNNIPIGAHEKLIEDSVFKGLIQENFFHLGSSLHRRDILENVFFDENIAFAEDRDFAIRLFMEKKATFGFREDPVFILYRHDSNLTRFDNISQNRMLISAHIFLFSKYLRNYSLTVPERLLLRKLISERLLDLAYYNRLGREYKAVLQCICRSCMYGISVKQVREVLKLFYTMITPPAKA